MNLFSSDIYLRTLAEVYFPGRAYAIESVRCGCQYFRLLVIDDRQVISRWRFMDFLEPVAEPPAAGARQVPYIPRAAVSTVVLGAAGITRAPGRAHTADAPFVQWSDFGSWAQFESALRARSGKLLGDSRRCWTKFEREHGALAFTFDDRADDALEHCVEWKSAQCARTFVPEMFKRNADIRMFRELNRRGLVIVSSLRTAGRPIAVHVGALHDARFYSWIPAYDREFATYSPGRLLLHALLKHSLESGHRQFDFLLGGEEYKWHYATHNRLIAPVGAVPLVLRVASGARARLKSALDPYPQLSNLARRLRRRLAA